MPKRTDIESILIIGAGPIVIGQACEFDYSGAQACKALRQEGYRVVLVNSNPATIMTDPEMADATYIEPIRWQAIKKIIEKERPDALLPTMGGQTALNCALDLAREGVLERFGVEMIGAKKEAIDKAEDREKFKNAMTKIGLESPRSALAHSLERREPVHLGQPDVENDQVDGSARQPVEARFAGADGLHLIALVAQHARQRRPDARLVVDDQDNGVGQHGRSIVNTVPRGVLSATSMLPPCSMTMRRTMASPRPLPRRFVE